MTIKKKKNLIVDLLLIFYLSVSPLVLYIYITNFYSFIFYLAPTTRLIYLLDVNMFINYLMTWKNKFMMSQS